MADDTPLPPGLYEQLLTEALRRHLPEGRADYTMLADDAFQLLTHHVAGVLDRALRAPGVDLTERVALCNRLLDEIAISGPTNAGTATDDAGRRGVGWRGQRRYFLRHSPEIRHQLLTDHYVP